MIEPSRQAPMSFCEELDISRVGFHARLVIGIYIDSSWIEYTFSPSYGEMICREPSQRLTAARAASGLYFMAKMSESASLLL